MRAVSVYCAIVLAASLAACGDDTSTGGASQGGAGSSTGGDAATGAAGPSSTTGGGGQGAGAMGGAGGLGGAGAGGSGGSEPDPCITATPTCDEPAPTASGNGLVPLDRCAFALDRTTLFDTYAARIDALEQLTTPVTLADVLGDLNRTPVVTNDVPGNPPALEASFRWDDEENDKPTWIPQGLTGSPDADPSGLVLGRKLWVVSFYFDEDFDPDLDPKGVRIAIVDVTDPDEPRYRFALLVEPQAGGDFTHVPIHAGGIAWVGDWLYVADTSGGLRVFDMGRILRVDTSADVIGCNGTLCQAGLYKYVVPQIGSYARWSSCDEQPRFSFVALDRGASPPRLVSGEYCSGSACSGPLAGRLFQWPLDPATGLLATDERTFASGAFFSGERQIQGAVSVGEDMLLSSSEPAGSAGILYRADLDGRSSHGWIDTPEDVMIDASDPASPKLVSLSEGLGERFVMQAALAPYLE